MKKIIPFTKEIDFNTMISKITDISIEHTLRAEDNNVISGYFIVEGTYKLTPASQIDEEFSYKIPVDVEIDENYDISKVLIDIDNFSYEIIEEDKLKINIDLCIDNIEENQSRENDEVIEDLFLETTKPIGFEIEKEENAIYDNNTKTFNYVDDSYISDDNENNQLKVPVVDKEPKKMDNDSKTSSLFTSFKDSAETFKTYYVYIVKEEDNLDTIINKYGVDKELLEDYNDLSKITTGSKIIIPSIKNE